ncbi:MAG: F0F1 ATP synthase subunit A [Myxococcales bacterium]|nr:F0F1 ATP synthase subunit A [Myxococcales bacterium]
MSHSLRNAARTVLLLLTLLALPTAAMASAPGSDHTGADHAAGAHAAGDHAASPAQVKEALRHFSLFNMLVPHDTEVALKSKVKGTAFEKTFIDKEDFVESVHLTHVFWAGGAFLLVLGLAFGARSALQSDADAGVLPARSFGPLLLFEVIVGAVYGLMKDMMGAEEARRYFPIVGSLGIYIFIMNIFALLPFGTPATDNLNTNIGMGLTVFVATHYAGIRANGIKHHIGHLMGPVLALAPLIFVLEVVGHLVRPVSLSLRLMGNMTGDHNVLFEFLYFKIPLLPLPVMFLGLLVCVVQTVVFVMLSSVYIAQAIGDGEHAEAH